MKRTIAVELLLGLLFAASICFGQSYTITDLGTLPGGSSSGGAGINASGQVTGSSTINSTSFSFHAFLYSADTGMVDLGTLPGASVSFGTGNASGQVTGYAFPSSSGFGDAFLYTASTGMVDLGTLPGRNYSRGGGINGSGQVTGLSSRLAVPC